MEITPPDVLEREFGVITRRRDLSGDDRRAPILDGFPDLVVAGHRAEWLHADLLKNMARVVLGDSSY